MYGSKQIRTAEGIPVSCHAASGPAKGNFRTHRGKPVPQNGQVYRSAAGSILAAFSGTVVDCPLPSEDLRDFR